MPYIPQKRRDEIDIRKALDDRPELGREFPENAGELNYVITEIIQYYIKTQGGLSYDVLNEVDGVLGLCQAEFRRRVVYPYEDHKIEVNGDVWDDFFVKLP